MIVFLHGWGMSKSVFSQFVDTFLLDDEVLLLDLPGYGATNYVDDLDQQVIQLAAAIPDGSHLVAWSLGGLYALKLVALYPKKLTRLTMVCSSPCFVQKTGFPYALTDTLLEQFSQQLMQDHKATIDHFLMLQLYGQAQATRYARDIRQKVLAYSLVRKEVLIFGLKCLQEVDCRAELQACTIPVQFILGKRDKIVPFEVSETIRALNSHVEVVVLERVGHLPFVTHGDIFYQVVWGKKSLG